MLITDVLYIIIAALTVICLCYRYLYKQGKETIHDKNMELRATRTQLYRLGYEQRPGEDIWSKIRE